MFLQVTDQTFAGVSCLGFNAYREKTHNTAYPHVLLQLSKKNS